MELREPIEDINKKLERDFGRFDDGRPNFRVIWSNDIFEKRWTAFTSSGIELLQPEVRELPKYRNWCPNRYILERLVPVPKETDLLTKTSYEPAWVFQDRNQVYLPPFYDGCVFVIESILEAGGKKGGFAKYKDETATEEARQAMIQKVQDDLFGNETDVGDHLAYGTGVVVPGSNAVN
jgi:hypothetical protein